MEVENEHAAGSNEAKTQVGVRANAIFIAGVDELHTSDIEKYMVELYNKPFQIEWIDDSSLNIVYDDSEDAFQALVAMTHPTEFEQSEEIGAQQLRKLKQMPNKPEVELQARFATEADRKQTGSRAKSRYYLFHGEPTRKEDLVRFGTKRSANPMKYGTKGREIIGNNLKRKQRQDDLFPEKAPTMNIEDDDVMDDLLPHLARKNKKKNRSRQRKNNNNNNKDLPDLFADKTEPENAAAPSVYQNMDY